MGRRLFIHYPLAVLSITRNQWWKRDFPTIMEAAPLCHKVKTAKRLVAQVPLGRLEDAEDIAIVGVFLACGDSSITNSSELVVDGGTIGAPMGARMFRR